MKRLFLDTSAIAASANSDHPSATRVDAAMDAFEGRLVTTNFIFDELVTLIASRHRPEVAARVGDALQEDDRVEIIRLTADDERDAWSLFKRRTDKRYSFTDCTSFVVMRRLGIQTALSLDADFRSEGFEVIP